jgi:hypothetical protein
VIITQSNRPTQGNTVRNRLPQKIGSQAFRENNRVEEWQRMEFNKSFNGANRLRIDYLDAVSEKTRGHNRPFAP